MRLSRPVLLAMLMALTTVGSGSSVVPTAPPDATAHGAADFFGNDRLHRFELTIAPGDFARMPGARRGWGRDATASDYTKVPAMLRFNGRDWGMISVRYKGNSSYRGAPSELKRSLKLDFNDAQKGRRFFGQVELHLNNNAFDPSGMREALSYDVFRRAGVPVPRTAFAEVYLTVPGEYQHKYAGLFSVIEDIDQHFFTERWNSKVGVLAKPENLFGMPALGADWRDYVEPYGIRITSRPDDVARIAAFIQFLNRAGDEEFAKRLDEFLDVEEFLHFLAAEVMLVNTDSPLAMDHNYLLTMHPGTHRIVWLPWDMNESFGTFRAGDVNLSIHRPSVRGNFPLAERVLANAGLRARYDAILRRMLADNFSLARIEPQMRRIAARIRDSVKRDDTMSLSAFEANFARSPAPDTTASFDGGWGAHSGPPLRAFIAERIASVKAQLEGN